MTDEADLQAAVENIDHPLLADRLAAIQKLLDSRFAPAIPALTASLTDRGRDERTRASAARALGKIAGEEAIPALVDALRDINPMTIRVRPDLPAAPERSGGDPPPGSTASLEGVLLAVAASTALKGIGSIEALGWLARWERGDLTRPPDLEGKPPTEKTIKTLPNPQAIYGRVLENAIRLVGAERGFIVLKNRQTGALDRFRLTRNYEPGQLPPANPRDQEFSVLQDILAKVAAEPAPTLTHNVRPGDTLTGKHRSYLLAPLQVDDALIGVLAVDRPMLGRSEAMTTEDRDKLANYASSIAKFFQRDYEKDDVTLAPTAVDPDGDFSAIETLYNQKADPDLILEHTLHAMLALTGADRGLLRLPGEFQIQVTQEIDPSDHTVKTLIQQAMASRQPVLSYLSTATGDAVPRTMIAAPVMHEDRMLGGVYVDKPLSEGALLQAQADALMTFAARVAPLLDTGDPPAGASSQTVQLSPDARSIAGRALDRILQATGAERGFVVLKEAGGQTESIASAGIDAAGTSADYVQSVLNEALKGQQILSTNAEMENRFAPRESIAAQTLRTVLAVPLLVGDEVIGAVYVDQKLRQGVFGGEALANASDIAREVSRELVAPTALENRTIDQGGTDPPGPAIGSLPDDEEAAPDWLFDLPAQPPAQPPADAKSVPAPAPEAPKPVAPAPQPAPPPRQTPPPPPAIAPSAPAVPSVPVQRGQPSTPETQADRSKGTGTLGNLLGRLRRGEARQDEAEEKKREESASNAQAPGASSSSTAPTFSTPTMTETDDLSRLEETFFSAYHPKTMKPDDWQPMHAYVFKGRAATSIMADAFKQLGEKQAGYSTTTKTASTPLPEGAQITATPHLPGFQFNPVSVTVAFYDDWTRLDFRLRARTAPVNQFVTGSITFAIEGVIAADVPLSVYVGEAGGAAEINNTVARAYQAIFCSYSHEDTAIVQRVERAYKALGLDYLRDVTTLRSGEHWGAEIYELIDRADIFQLFWSKSASESQYVRQEWQHALKYDGVRANFIRPVWWQEPMPAVPPELSHIHFAYEPGLDD